MGNASSSTRLLRTTIVNGSLLSQGRSGVGLNFQTQYRYPQFLNPWSPARIPSSVAPADRFAPTRHRLENLTIEAGNTGIIIEGSDNVIRNNHIVVDSATAIIAKGPGLILEDNIIEVRDTLDERFKPGFGDGVRLPVHLVQADGAIVRNNQIRYIGPAAWRKLPAAVELVESRDVLIENNRIDRIESIVRADAGSSSR